MDRNRNRMGMAALVLIAAIGPAAAGLTAAAGMAAAGDDTAPGSLTAAGILERCDAFHYFYGDSHMTVTSILEDKEGKKTEMGMEMWEKGEKRLMQFLSPPDVAGMAVLVKDEDTIYVYDPEFNKVRRIATHAKKQTMLGSDYSFDEMATKALHPSYDATIESEDSGKAVLLLVQKQGEAKAWPSLRVHVDKKKHWMASTIEYLDAAGKKKKVEERGTLKSFSGHLIPTVIKMTTIAKKHSTTNVVKTAEHDKGLPDEMFTKRFLIREE